MVQSVTVFDEDFTEDDMAAALTWRIEDKLTCSCGFPLEESTAPGRDYAYDADVMVCHACAMRDRKERGYREGGGDMAGIRTRVWEIDDSDG